MRFGSSALSGALSGSFDHYWVADLFYDGERRLANVPITDVSFTENADATIQHSGSCTVVWADEFATSVAPDEVSDMFAPFGAQLAVYSVVSAGEFSERVAYGRFEITNVPSAVDENMLFRGEWITVGSRVELELKELLAGVGEERFDVPSAPVDLDSTWAELSRITGLQLTRTVDDVPITRTIMYPESKLDATYDLMSVMLDAVPHMTGDGTLAARPNVWPAPVAALVRGDGGTVVSVGSQLSSAQVYNRVVVRAGSGDQAAVLAVAEVSSGPLRVRNPDGSVSPFRARTKYLSSELVTTEEQAQVWAESELEKVSTLRSRVVPVVELFNPLRERGDVITIDHGGLTLTGRVQRISRNDPATQDLVVEVASQTTRVDPVIPDWPEFVSSALYPSSSLFPSSSLYPKG
jgi:hypothetical protein